MDGVFLGLAGLLLRISLGLHPQEIPCSSPSSPWKTLSIPPLLLGLTQSIAGLGTLANLEFGNLSMSNKDDRRTAPATPGLLNTYQTCSSISSVYIAKQRPAVETAVDKAKLIVPGPRLSCVGRL